MVDAFKSWWYEDALLSFACKEFLRFGLLGWIGLSLFYFCERSLRRVRESDRSLHEHPESPWLANRNWHGAILRHSDAISWQVMVFLLFSVGWIGLPLVGTLTSPAYVAGTFALLTILSTCLFVARRHYAAWSSSELELETIPVPIGGTMRATFRIGQEFLSDTIFAATLQCTYLMPYSRSDETDNNRRIYWAQAIDIPRSQLDSKGTTHIPIQFSIPSHCPESTIHSSCHESMRDVRWILLIQVKDAGQSGISRFEIPVFRTIESVASSVSSDEQVSVVAVGDAIHQLLKPFQFTESKQGDQIVTMTFRLKNPEILKVALILGILCVAAIAAIIMFVSNVWVQLFLAFVPAMLLLAIAFNLGEYWLWRGKLIRDHDQLTIDYGIPWVQTPLRCAANAETTLHREVTFQSQSQVHESWNLYIHYRGEKRILFRQLGSQTEVESLQKWLASRLGIGFVESEHKAEVASIGVALKPIHNQPPAKRRTARKK